MARPKNIIPTVLNRIMVPEDLDSRLDLMFFDPLTNRVPYGTKSGFILQAIRTALDTSHLDLSPYLGSLPGTFTVQGSPEVLRQLEEHLKGKPRATDT